MTTSHDPNLTVNVGLDALPPASPSFQIALMAVPLASNSLNGDRVRSYTQASDAADDETAGYISALTSAQIQSCFGQTRPDPNTVKVAYVDLAGTETYDNVISNGDIAAFDPDFYGYCIQDHTAGATALAVSSAIQTEDRRIFGFQSDDATWLTSGVPVAYSGIEANERTLGFFHDTVAEPFDFAGFAAGLQDPDSFSAPWTMRVDNVAAYAADLTPGERLLAIGNNINVLGEFGSVPNWNDPGTNIAGRTMRAIVMRDWLRARLEERVFDYIATLSNRNEPIPVTPGGQSGLANILAQLIEEGVTIGHFESGEITLPAITATDISLRRLRVQANIIYIVDGRLVTFDIFLNATA